MLERYSIPLVLICGTLLGAMPSAHAADDEARAFSAYLGARLSGEDNLYRLPEGLDPELLLGPGASREDRIASTLLGVDGHWQLDRHEVVLDTLASTHRFSENTDLDNTSGQAALRLNWQLGRRWSGQVGGNRARKLASFANTRALEKDIVDSAGYRGSARLALGSRWAATIGARSSAARHSNETRRDNDVDVRSGDAGVEYQSPSGNLIGLEYEYSDAAFVSAPRLGDGAGTRNDYEERTARMNLGYALSSKVTLRGSLGYLERSYPYADRSFSGDVWQAALQWSPTLRVRVLLQQWRELRAQLDAEAAHYVSDGTGLVAAWTPLESIEIALQVSREEQNYIAAIPDPDAPSARADEPSEYGLSFAYSPRERVLFDFSYRGEIRESNRPRFDYDSQSVSIACEFRF